MALGSADLLGQHCLPHTRQCQLRVLSTGAALLSLAADASSGRGRGGEAAASWEALGASAASEVAGSAAGRWAALLEELVLGLADRGSSSALLHNQASQMSASYHYRATAIVLASVGVSWCAGHQLQPCRSRQLVVCLGAAMQRQECCPHQWHHLASPLLPRDALHVQVLLAADRLVRLAAKAYAQAARCPPAFSPPASTS